MQPKPRFGVLRFDHGSDFQNFGLEILRTFTPIVPKISLHDLLPILAIPTAENFDSAFLTKMRPNGSSFQICPLGRVLRTGTWRQWSRKFLPRFFYPFWAPHDRKLRFSLFDQGATKWVKFPNFSPRKSISDRNFTPVVPKLSLHDFLLILVAPPPKISIRSFWPNCDQMGQVSKFYQFSVLVCSKWVNNPGGKLSGPLA